MMTILSYLIKFQCLYYHREKRSYFVSVVPCKSGPPVTWLTVSSSNVVDLGYLTHSVSWTLNWSNVTLCLYSSMPYSVNERLCIVEAYTRTRSFKRTREIFRERYPNTSIPAKSTVQKLIQKWRETGSVFNAKRNRLPSVQTPEAVANIQQNIIANLKKSVRNLSQQTFVQRMSCYRILKSLHLEKWVQIVFKICA